MQSRTIWAIAVLREMEQIRKEQEQEAPITIRSISELIGISREYVEQICVPLKNAGVISSVRGLRGGFFLERESLCVGELKSIMEGKLNYKRKYHKSIHALLDNYYKQTGYVESEIKVIG